MARIKPGRPGLLALMAAAQLGLGAAQAAGLPGPRPVMTPTHAVTIDYIVTTADTGTLDIRVAALPGAKRMRITSPELPTMLLVNRVTGMADVVLPVLRAYSQLNIRRYDPEQNLLRQASFTRQGAAKIAGRACTRWLAVADGGNAEGCFTADGVLLEGKLTSARQGEELRVIARAVADYAPPPEEFEIPEGFSESPFRLDPRGFGK